jgi:hypothetical protein
MKFCPMTTKKFLAFLKIALDYSTKVLFYDEIRGTKLSNFFPFSSIRPVEVLFKKFYLRKNLTTLFLRIDSEEHKTPCSNHETNSMRFIRQKFKNLAGGNLKFPNLKIQRMSSCIQLGQMTRGAKIAL